MGLSSEVPETEPLNGICYNEVVSHGLRKCVTGDE